MDQTTRGITTSEFWTTLAVVLPALVENLGWKNNAPLSEAGQITMWCVMGAVGCVYIGCRSWVKVATSKGNIK